MNRSIPSLRYLAPVAFLLALASAGISMGQTPDRLATTPAALIVEIDTRGNVSLNERPYGTVRDTKRLTDRLTEIFAARTQNLVFADRDGATQTQIPLDQRIAKGVYVHPDQSLLVADLLKFLTDLRETKASPINLKMNRGDIAHQVQIEGTVPSGLVALPEGKPDPRFLLVVEAPNQGVTLNGEHIGSLEALTEKLKTVFANRRTNHDYSPGTMQIPQAVWLQLDPTLKLENAVDVVQAIAFSYARPIILRLEAPERTYLDVPPRPSPTRPTRRRTRRP